MKLEKISENQIRCILTRGELLKRNLTYKKLTSGGSESRALLREILEQSFDELGFQANDTPLMIEASPMAEGNLAFTITKADPRAILENSSELTKALQHILRLAQSQLKDGAPDEAPSPAPASFTVFAFEAKEPLHMPPTLGKDPVGVHTALYLAPRAKTLYLTVTAGPRFVPAFNAACHLLSEYGRALPGTAATEDYYKEHYVTVFAHNALKHISAGEPVLPN